MRRPVDQSNGAELGPRCSRHVAFAETHPILLIIFHFRRRSRPTIPALGHPRRRTAMSMLALAVPMAAAFSASSALAPSASIRGGKPELSISRRAVAGKFSSLIAPCSAQECGLRAHAASWQCAHWTFRSLLRSPLLIEMLYFLVVVLAGRDLRHFRVMLQVPRSLHCSSAFPPPRRRPARSARPTKMRSASRR